MSLMDFSVSDDTQAILLLCGTLGSSGNKAPVLTLPQYNALALSLNGLGKRPADLLHDEKLVEKACAIPPENTRLKEPASPERIKALLDRGFALSMSLNRWAQYGVRPVGRGDGLYPSCMKKYLKGKAPAVLYYAGNETLFSGGGMAVVGSRDISPEASDAIHRVVRECVAAGMAIVSGGARGADQISMRGAFERGGRVVGALPGDLLKACIARENRDALARGQILLFSAVDPDERFTPINAMDRNKYIYAMADFAFVAQSDTKGGTWTGAVEELKRPDHHPLFVYMGNERIDGCAKLVAKGGIAWSPADSLQAMLEKGRAVSPAKPPTAMQSTLFDFAAAVPPSDSIELKVSAPSTPCVAHDKTDVYSALVSVVLATLAQKSHPEKTFRKAVDPEGYISPKGWKMLLEQACADGTICCEQIPQKRGKPGKWYSLPQAHATLQSSLFDFATDVSPSDAGTLKVSEPSVAYVAHEKADVYSSLLAVVVEELAQKNHTEKTFKTAVDPTGYISPKGWKMLLEKACLDGKIACKETTKKRGKTEKCYALP